MKLLNNVSASENGSAGKDQGEVKSGKNDLLSTVRNMIPKSFRVAVSKTLLPRSVNEKLSLHWKTAGIAWEHTRAFLIDNANEGFIRINLKGREPQGIVEPGTEYHNLCEEIYQTVTSMTNPANGKRAAHTVHKTDDIYGGPCRSHMPDVIIQWNEDAKLTTELLTKKYGIARSLKPGYGITPYYTGNHRPNAFTVAVGPGIPAGRVLKGTSILDLAPTLLAYFGIKPPAYMDGRVLSGLFHFQQCVLTHDTGIFTAETPDSIKIQTTQ
jgi:predicted AlkP superfamily phosphohydrolase/phosphomutase